MNLITIHIKYHCGTVELQMDFKSVSSHALSCNKSLTIQEIKGIYAKMPLFLFSILSGYLIPKFKRDRMKIQWLAASDRTTEYINSIFIMAYKIICTVLHKYYFSSNTNTERAFAKIYRLMQGTALTKMRVHHLCTIFAHGFQIV